MTFSDRIWSSATQSWGGLVTFVGFSVTLLTFFITPRAEVIPLNIVLVIVIGMFVVSGVFVRAAFDANKDTKITSPRIMTVIDSPVSYKTGSALLLIEPTELLSFDSLVSLYYMDDGFEIFYGIGQVINIQNDKKVQVLLLNTEVPTDTVESLKKNNKEDLARLIVKPSVPSNFLRGGE